MGEVVLERSEALLKSDVVRRTGHELRSMTIVQRARERLRETAERLRKGSDYKWANFGLCNCGHLAQTVTHRSAKEIHEAALEKGGDWGEQAREYCGITGLAMDHILDALMNHDEKVMNHDEISSFHH